MRKIVVASHSLLAQGFKDTLEFLTGKSDAINAVCAYVNDNGEGLDAAVEAALSGTDEVVVLTDALGGSVNQRSRAPTRNSTSTPSSTRRASRSST